MIAQSALVMQEYNFSIEHWLGIKHQNADTLSCQPRMNKDEGGHDNATDKEDGKDGMPQSAPRPSATSENRPSGAAGGLRSLSTTRAGRDFKVAYVEVMAAQQAALFTRPRKAWQAGTVGHTKPGRQSLKPKTTMLQPHEQSCGEGQ